MMLLILLSWTQFSTDMHEILPTHCDGSEFFWSLANSVVEFGLYK